MLDRLNTIINGADVPNLFLAQRVVDNIARGAMQYIEDETGEAMIGLIIPDTSSDKKSVYVIDTIAPGDNAVRQTHTFQQGGAWQDDVLQWLRENWQVARRKRTTSYGSSTARWDSSLFHVGDWHKQPGFMIQPSMGDLQTALDFINDAGNQIGFLVAPIVTINHPLTVKDRDDTANFLRVEQSNGLMTRIDFWYIARGMNSFAPITPHILPDSNFPRLMEYPWHLIGEQRAYQEMKLLEDEGLLVEVLLWDTDEELPLEVCFLTARPGDDHFLLIATPYNYPHATPDMYKIPFESIQPDEDLYDLMKRMWTHAELLEDPADWNWSSEKTLLEYVYMTEDAQGWRASPLAPAAEAAAQPEAADAPASDTPTADESAAE